MSMQPSFSGLAYDAKKRQAEGPAPDLDRGGDSALGAGGGDRGALSQEKIGSRPQVRLGQMLRLYIA